MLALYFIFYTIELFCLLRPFVRIPVVVYNHCHTVIRGYDYARTD